mgnify:CR=1 FL=1
MDAEARPSIRMQRPSGSGFGANDDEQYSAERRENTKGGKGAAGKGTAGPIQAPTQQAIGAAARALKDHGFKPPQGLQMQISFVPKKEPAKNTTPKNAGRGGRGGGRGWLWRLSREEL